MVQSSSGRLYTRNGQLQLNANNEIVNDHGATHTWVMVSNDNFTLSGIRNQFIPLTIPLGQERVSPKQPKTPSMTGVLNPAVQLKATQPEIVESVVLGDGDDRST